MSSDRCPGCGMPIVPGETCSCGSKSTPFAGLLSGVALVLVLAVMAGLAYLVGIGSRSTVLGGAVFAGMAGLLVIAVVRAPGGGPQE